MASILKLPNTDRYDHFLKEVWEEQAVWSLKSPEGWVLIGDGKSDLKYLPIWPKRDYAQLCAVDEWSDTIPTPIAIEDWILRWLPEMERDNDRLSVFPTAESPGLIVPPSGHRNDLLAFASQAEFDDEHLNELFDKLAKSSQ